jgi:SAM-dependent methyltransferase
MTYAFGGSAALQYEHFEQGSGSYRHQSESLVKLLDTEEGDSVLEFLTGTGVTTKAIIDIRPRVRNIISFEKSREMLEIARYRFNQYQWPELLEEELAREPYAGLIEDTEKLKTYIQRRDLVSGLRRECEETRRFGGDVIFIEEDVADFLVYLEEEKQFDVGVMSNGYHWIWKHKMREEIMEGLNKKIKKGGLLGFNTTGADLDFGEEELDFRRLNDLYRGKSHPFYLRLRQLIREQWSGVPERLQYTFTLRNIDEEMEKHGFKLRDRKFEVVQHTPDQFVELMLMGGPHHFIGLELPRSVEEMNKTFVSILDRALIEGEESLLRPIYSTVAHFVYTKEE